MGFYYIDYVESLIKEKLKEGNEFNEEQEDLNYR